MEQGWTRPQDDELDAEGVPKSFRQTMRQVALMLGDTELLDNARSSIHDSQHSTSFTNIHAKYFGSQRAPQSLAVQQRRALPPPTYDRPSTGQHFYGRYEPPPASRPEFDRPEHECYFPKARAWHRQQQEEEARRNGWPQQQPRPATMQQRHFQSQLAPSAARDHFKSQFGPARPGHVGTQQDAPQRPMGLPPQSDRDREFLRHAWRKNQSQRNDQPFSRTS